MSIGICFDDLYVSRVERPYEDLTKSYQRYDELNTKIRQLTGFNVAQLERLFAAGYTLTPPKYASLSESFSEEESI